MVTFCAGEPHNDLLTQIPEDPLLAAQFYALDFQADSPTRVDEALLRLYMLGNDTETIPSFRVDVLQLPSGGLASVSPRSRW